MEYRSESWYIVVMSAQLWNGCTATSLHLETFNVKIIKYLLQNLLLALI
ncbi:MAG: hypothetical protein WBA39_03795 [Rivularia sp. (in: cyanobacteria)]